MEKIIKAGEIFSTRKIIESNFIKKKQRYLKTAFSILFNEEDAKDAVQEAYYQAIKYMKELKDINSFDVWFYKILINKCKQMYNKAKHTKNQIAIDETMILLDSAQSERQLDDRLLIKDIISNLSNDHREVIVLKYIQGFSLKEISEILNLPIGTVKSRLFYAIEKLKSHYNRKEGKAYEL